MARSRSVGGSRRCGGAAARRRREQPIEDFAIDELSRRRKKIKKRASKVERLDPRRRHKLRIASKKLRYGVEFFAS